MTKLRHIEIKFLDFNSKQILFTIFRLILNQLEFCLVEEEGEVKGKYGRIWGEERGNADCGKIVQPSQENVAPLIEGVEWKLGTKSLRIVQRIQPASGRGYTEGRSTPTLYMRCQRNTLLIATRVSNPGSKWQSRKSGIFFSKFPGIPGIPGIHYKLFI